VSEISRLSAALAKQPQSADLAIQLAQAQTQAGRWQQGLALMRQAAALHPEHRGVALCRVALMVQAEQWPQAVREGTAVLQTFPDHAEVWRLVAQAASALDAPGMAMDAWKSSLVHEPDHRRAWFALATLQLQHGAFSASVQSLRRAHSLGPPDGAILNHLGAALLQAGSILEAQQRMQEAVDVDPKRVSSWLGLAQCHMTQGHEEDAERAFQRATNLEPERPHTRLVYARFLVSVGRSAEAEAQLQEVLQAAPQSRPARLGLGRVLERKGDHAAAIALLEPLMTPDLKDVDALTAWARSCARVSRAEEALKRLEPHTKRLLTPTEAQLLHHTIGDLYKALGRWEQTFAAHQTGNRHRERDVTLQGFVQEVARASDLLAKPVQRTSALGSGMIFIVGMPRSGTSLIEQILSRHPAVTAGGELPSLNRTLRPEGTPPVGAEWAERVATAPPSQWDALGRAYLADAASMASMRAEDLSAQVRLTDKQPTNFVFLGAIARILPGARIIHCARDPLDTCLSCFFQNFGPGHAWSTELSWTAEMFRVYRAQMAWWTTQASIEVIDVQYETLVSDLEREVHRLLDALDLPFHPDCLTFHESTRDARTASVDQVRQPIYPSSVGRAERYRPWLGPLIDGLDDLDSLPAANELVSQ